VVSTVRFLPTGTERRTSSASPSGPSGAKRTTRRFSTPGGSCGSFLSNRSRTSLRSAPRVVVPSSATTPGRVCSRTKPGRLTLRRLARRKPSRRILDLGLNRGRFGRRRPLSGDDIRDVVEERASPRSPATRFLWRRGRSWSGLRNRFRRHLRLSRIVPPPSRVRTQEPFHEIFPLVLPLLVTSCIGKDGLTISDEGGHSDRLGVPSTATGLSPNPRGIRRITTTEQAGSRSRLGRRLEFLAFPQGERFLWLGLCRSGSGCGNLGY
jgi:hypothetical protein